MTENRPIEDQAVIEGAEDAVAAPSPPAEILGLSQTAWLQVGVITALFAALFWPNLRRLWDKTNPFYGDPNWGHAVCIPVIGLYYLYVNRKRLLLAAPLSTAPSRVRGLEVWFMAMLVLVLPLPLVRVLYAAGFVKAALGAAILLLAALLLCVWFSDANPVRLAYEHSAGWFGGFVLLLGITLYAYGIYPGQNDFVKDFGMVVTLFGVVLALAGWGPMRVAWFPIAFLVCGIPWPGLIYSRVAGPLQQLAANVAVWTLQLTGVEASAGGTKIVIEGYNGVQRTLNVAEACAGLRSLMTFISVGAAVAFLSSRPLWQKLIVVLSAIPIAIFCNVMRVSGQGLLDHYISQQLSENFAHQFVGLIMLIPAFLLILLVGWILDQIFVEQVDRRHVAIAPKVISRTTPVTAPAILAATRPAPRSLAAVRAAEAASRQNASPGGVKPPAPRPRNTGAPANRPPAYPAPRRPDGNPPAGSPRWEAK